MKTLVAALMLLAPATFVAATNAPVRMDAAVQSDIEYGTAAGVSLRLDAGVPPGAGPFPIAILVHGGGWSTGDKRDMEFLSAGLGGKFTWFSVNYRLGARYPACLEDVEQAIRWVRTHAAQYKGDPRKIVLIGYSAGGHLAAMAAERNAPVNAVVALAAPADILADVERSGGLRDSHRKLFGDRELNDEVRGVLRDASPIHHVKRGLPPFLLMQGTADKFFQSVNFQTALRAAGVAAELVLIHGAPHDITQWEKLDPTYEAQIVAWIDRALAGRAQNDDAHAGILVERFEDKTNLIALPHFDDVERRPVENDVGAFAGRVDLDAKAVEGLQARIGKFTHAAVPLKGETG